MEITNVKECDSEGMMVKVFRMRRYQGSNPHIGAGDITVDNIGSPPRIVQKVNEYNNPIRSLVYFDWHWWLYFGTHCPLY